MYKVVLLPKAERTFARADASLAKKLAGCFESLEADPLRHPNIKPLVGQLKGLFRFRAGDYRILYQIVVPNLRSRHEVFPWRMISDFRLKVISYTFKV
jgi:mRNA interferase RelE/StbE